MESYDRFGLSSYKYDSFAVFVLVLCNKKEKN